MIKKSNQSTTQKLQVTLKDSDSLSRKWQRNIDTLLPIVNIIHGYSRDYNLGRFKSMVKVLYENKGPRETIKTLKGFRHHLQQFVLQQTVVPISFRKTDSSGYLKVISFIKPDLNDLNSIRYAQSIMRIIDSFRLPPAYEVSTITEPSTADPQVLSEIISFIRQWKRLINEQDAMVSVRPLLSNKSGPNGPQAANAEKDLLALLDDPDLFDAIFLLLERFDPRSKYFPRERPEQGCAKYKHSKLCLLSDKAGKTRVIAIADYWSNLVLTPIHDLFMRFLKGLKSDVTYRQNEIPNLVRKLGPRLYSSDLTAFTDRFPIELEEEVVSVVFGAKTARFWRTILTKRTFHHPKGDVTYNCGNPMGVLSSWPVSTVAHHAVKLWCAYKVGKKKYKYLILGDDTIDTSLDVYSRYTSTMKSLGVSISLSKCTQSEVGSAEFAKRHFLNHQEVTGIPLLLLTEAQRKPELVIEFYKICLERGYESRFLKQSLTKLITVMKYDKLLLDMLSLPEKVLGMPPLLEGKPGYLNDRLRSLSDKDLEEYLLDARSYFFWKTVPTIEKLGSKITDDEHIPYESVLYSCLEFNADRYLEPTDNPYSVYDSWLLGDFKNLVDIPRSNTYKYATRDKYVSKCNFEVLKLFLRQVGGDTSIRLTPKPKISNNELYWLAQPISTMGDEK